MKPLSLDEMKDLTRNAHRASAMYSSIGESKEVHGLALAVNELAQVVLAMLERVGRDERPDRQ